LQKKTRSLLDELDSMLARKELPSLIESRADHVIQGAINLLKLIRENYDDEAAGELERRLLNSIRSQDPSKFQRGVRRLRNNENH
jgi:hypothetical protein